MGNVGPNVCRLYDVDEVDGRHRTWQFTHGLPSSFTGQFETYRIGHVE